MQWSHIVRSTRLVGRDWVGLRLGCERLAPYLELNGEPDFRGRLPRHRLMNLPGDGYRCSDNLGHGTRPAAPALDCKRAAMRPCCHRACLGGRSGLSGPFSSDVEQGLSASRRLHLLHDDIWRVSTRTVGTIRGSGRP